MKLTELKLRNFTVFEQADFSFVPGINVFIGENGTGKSHVLKVLYALLRGVRVPPVDKVEAERLQRERLAGVFKVDGGNAAEVGRLVRLGKEDEGATIAMAAGPQAEMRIRVDPSGELVLMEQRWPERLDSIFLPARDVLAMCEGFVALYDEYRISFDESYRDVCQALTLPELRAPERQVSELLSTTLQPMLRGSLTVEDGRFYVDFGAGKHEAHLVAEGLRKLAALIQLIRNGSIRPGSVLLWDEPEANMNPRLIAKLADALRSLAAFGVQIFIATHDYLLSHRLSLAAEYVVAPNVEMKFFALYREQSVEPVVAKSAATLADIPHNAILEEYAGHYEYERSLYLKEIEQDKNGGSL